MAFAEGSLTFKEFAVKETLRLSVVHDAVFVRTPGLFVAQMKIQLDS